MQFTRHEMPINIKIENDLLLWEIEVISVRRSILLTYVLFLSFSMLPLHIDSIMIYIFAIFRSRRAEKHWRKTSGEDFFIWTSKEKLLLLHRKSHKSIMNEAPFYVLLHFSYLHRYL